MSRPRGPGAGLPGGWQVEILRLAASSLNANKMRGGLTILGIVIGISSVVGMVSLVEGLNRSMQGQLDALGSDVIRIRRFDAGVFVGGVPDSLRKIPHLTDDDADEIRRSSPSVLGVTAHLETQQRLRFQGEQSRMTQILGIDEHFLRVHARGVGDGRGFTDMEVRGGARVALIGHGLQEQLFPGIDPVDQQVQIGTQRFLVIGVMSERGNFLGSSLDNEVLIPRTALERYFDAQGQRVQLAARPTSPTKVAQAQDEIIEALRRSRGLRPRDDNNFALVTQGNLLSLYNQVTGAFFVVIMAIASVALLVGGIGVMNIMLVSVTERTREIGVRKALGATRRQIMFQFLAEAMALTAFGGVLGILIGAGLGKLVEMITPLPAYVPPWAYIVAFSVSAGVGLFFGSWPAVRASRLDPVDALRYE